jgi:hypothetical protein
VQSNLLELPRCEGGKDYEVGLKEKGERKKEKGEKDHGVELKEKDLADDM